VETRLLLVRHPETTANVDGRFVGRGQAPLTVEGHRQRRRLVPKVAAFRPDVVWTSPLDRALAVSRPSARRAGVPLMVDDRLLELDFGAAEGMTIEQVRRAGLAFNYRNANEPVAPGGESRAQIEGRAAAFCDELLAAGGRHAIVTHGGVFRASLVHVLALASSDIWAFDIRNAQLAEVLVVDGHGMLKDYRQG
jgi:broad specificity phosphatase PhoE